MTTTLAVLAIVMLVSFGIWAYFAPKEPAPAKLSCYGEWLASQNKSV